MKMLLIVFILTLSGCASTHGWTIDSKVYKIGEDKCHVRKSKVKFCHRFHWPNGDT